MRRVLFCCLFLGLLSGCSGQDPFKPDVPQIKHTDLYVANFSAESILEVYVRPQGGGDWGATRISSPISGGNLYAPVGNVLSGLYDIRMVGQVNTREVLDFNCVSEYVAVSFRP